jgi:CheY-like chemotaxis protein
MDRDAADFDLLITDMLLPDGMNGRQVAAEFMANNADGRVLYISGYAPDTEINDGKLDDGHDFLAKPFTRKALQRRVADILQR